MEGRLSNSKLAAIIAGVLLLALAGILLWLRSIGDANWEAMRIGTEKMLRQAQSRDAARPVLRGTAQPGDAWTDYAEALADVERSSKTFNILNHISNGKPPADETAVDAFVAKHSNAIVMMRRGAARSGAQYPVQWNGALSNDFGACKCSHKLALLAVAQSRMLKREEKHREAAEILLDTLVFGVDHGANGVPVSEGFGLLICKTATDELRELILSRNLSRQDLLAVARELEILDRAIPDPATMLRNASIAARASLLKDPGGIRERAGWRHGFSPRILVTRGIEEAEALLEAAIEAGRKPWKDCKAEQQAVWSRSQNSENPIAGAFVPKAVATAILGRTRWTQFRLMRVAAHYLATGDVLDLDDPFGVKLRTLKAFDGLKIWSLGEDGVDNEGVKNWPDPRAGDIVLDIKK